MTISKLAALNDAFRQNPQDGWHYTSGVVDRGPTFVMDALMAVTGFDTFTADNDPHGEHDFGSVEIAGQKLFWKIDCYAMADFERGSEDPADPTKTSRVLTIMLASEY